MDLTFVYDLSCPYAYLASTSVERLAAETSARLRWWPALLGGIWRKIGAPDQPATSWNPTKAALNAKDLRREAELRGVPLPRPDERPGRTVDALRLLWSVPESERPGLTRALFRAFWVQGRDISDRAVLTEIARARDLDPAGMDSPNARKALFDATDQAVAWGAFGVPSYVVGDKLFWGQDREHLVRRALGGALTAAECTGTMPVPRNPPPKLRFFHDFASPFSYLGSSQVESVAHAHGAALEYTPILLGALFKDIGSPDVPLFAMNEPRRRWYLGDLLEHASWWDIPFRFPTEFPIRTVLPLRIAIVEPKTTNVLYRAAWAEDRNIGLPEVCADVLGDAGFDAAALLAAAESPEVKNQLRANTTAAIAAGVCGVPSFQVDDRYLFWGQDRLHQVEEALHGWRPTAG